MRVAQRAACPVLVVPDRPGCWPPVRVILGEDFTAAARQAAAVSVGIARAYGAQLVLVEAIGDFENVMEHSLGAGPHVAEDILTMSRESLDDRARVLAPELGSDPEERIEFGDPAAIVLWTAAQATASVIALGRPEPHSYDEQSRMAAAIAARVLRHATGPVMLASSVPEAPPPA